MVPLLLVVDFDVVEEGKTTGIWRMKKWTKRNELQDEMKATSMDLKFVHVVPLLAVDFDVTGEEGREENWYVNEEENFGGRGESCWEKDPNFMYVVPLFVDFDDAEEEREDNFSGQ